MWPAKDKILILWPFTERDDSSLVYITLSQERPSERLSRGIHNKQRIGKTRRSLGFE